MVRERKKKVAPPQAQTNGGEPTRGSRTRSRAKARTGGKKNNQQNHNTDVELISMVPFNENGALPPPGLPSSSELVVSDPMHEANMNYAAAEENGYHLVFDNPPGNGIQDAEGITYYTTGEQMDFVNGNELVYPGYGYADEGNSSTGMEGVPGTLVVGNQSMPQTSSVYLQPGQLVVTGSGENHQKLPASKLLYGKYAFPKQLQPYNPGTRTYITLSAEDMEEVNLIGGRNFAAWRALLAEGNALNAIEEFERAERQRKRQVYRLAKAIQEGRYTRELVEEENSRVKEELTRRDEQFGKLQQEMQRVVSENEQLSVRIIADRKTQEQQMLHDAKFNEMLEDNKVEFTRKLKEAEAKSKKLARKVGLLKKKLTRAQKELAKYKRAVSINPAKEKRLEKEMLAYLCSVALNAVNPQIASIIQRTMKSKFPRSESEFPEANKRVAAIFARICHCVENKEEITENEVDDLAQAAMEDESMAKETGAVESDDDMVSVHEYALDLPVQCSTSVPATTSTSMKMRPRAAKAEKKAVEPEAGTSRTSTTTTKRAVMVDGKVSTQDQPQPHKDWTSRLSESEESDVEVEVDAIVDFNKVIDFNKVTADEVEEFKGSAFVGQVQNELDLGDNELEEFKVSASVGQVRQVQEDLDLSDSEGELSDDGGTEPESLISTQMGEKHTEDDKNLKMESKHLKRESKPDLKAKLGKRHRKKALKKKSPKKAKKGTLPAGLTKKMMAELEQAAVTGEQYNEHAKKRRASRREKLSTPLKSEPEVEIVEPSKTDALIVQVPETETSRRKRVMAKIGDTTLPQPVVASCDKTKLNLQIERARENKKRRGKEADNEEPKFKKLAVESNDETTFNNNGPSTSSGCRSNLALVPALNEHFDSPRSPPLAFYNEVEFTETPENLNNAVDILNKYFHGKTLENLKQVSEVTHQELINDLACPPVVLARAVFDMILMDKSQKLVERLISFLEVLETCNNGFEHFGEVIIQNFGRFVSKHKTDKTSDAAYRKLGQFSGMLLGLHEKKYGVGSQNEKALDIIMNCMYWKPDRAVAFLHLLLQQYSDPLNMHKNVYNATKTDATFKFILYVAHRGKKGSPQNSKMLKNFLTQSLRHNKPFEGTGFPEFIDEIVKQLKEMEGDKPIQRAFKYFAMLFMHFDDWTQFTDFANVQLTKAWNEFNANEIPPAIVVAFLQMIGDVVSDMEKVGEITALQQAVSSIRSTDPDIKLAVLKCMERLDTRNATETAVAETKPVVGARRSRGGGAKRGKKNKKSPPAAAAPTTSGLAMVPVGNEIQIQPQSPKKKNRGKPIRFSY